MKLFESHERVKECNEAELYSRGKASEYGRRLSKVVLDFQKKLIGPNDRLGPITSLEEVMAGSPDMFSGDHHRGFQTRPWIRDFLKKEVRGPLESKLVGANPAVVQEWVLIKLEEVFNGFLPEATDSDKVIIDETKEEISLVLADCTNKIGLITVPDVIEEIYLVKGARKRFNENLELKGNVEGFVKLLAEYYDIDIDDVDGISKVSGLKLDRIIDSGVLGLPDLKHLYVIGKLEEFTDEEFFKTEKSFFPVSLREALAKWRTVSRGSKQLASQRFFEVVGKVIGLGAPYYEPIGYKVEEFLGVSSKFVGQLKNGKTPLSFKCLEISSRLGLLPFIINPAFFTGDMEYKEAFISVPEIGWLKKLDGENFFHLEIKRIKMKSIFSRIELIQELLNAADDSVEGMADEVDFKTVENLHKASEILESRFREFLAVGLGGEDVEL